MDRMVSQAAIGHFLVCRAFLLCHLMVLCFSLMLQGCCGIFLRLEDMTRIGVFVQTSWKQWLQFWMQPIALCSSTSMQWYLCLSHLFFFLKSQACTDSQSHKMVTSTQNTLELISLGSHSPEERGSALPMQRKGEITVLSNWKAGSHHISHLLSNLAFSPNFF